MKLTRLPPANMNYHTKIIQIAQIIHTIQIRNTSAMKELDHELWGYSLVSGVEHRIAGLYQQKCLKTSATQNLEELLS